MAKESGKIIIPHGLRPEEHEFKTADVFTALGKDVEFLQPMRSKKSKTPDAMIDGIAWGIKSPTGNSKTTVSNTLKRAVRQASHVVFDARRTKIADETIETEIRRNMMLTRSLKKVILITKTSKIIEVRKQ